MEIIELNKQQLNNTKPICSAIGFFDGFHKGHMALIKEVKKVALKNDYQTAVITFDHHPLYILGKISEEKYLMSMEERISLLKKENIDYLFIISFTKELAHMSPYDFIDEYLLRYSIAHIVCGFDFHFGYNNQGNVKMLKKHPKIEVSIVDEVLYEKEKVSSSHIRNDLKIGNVEHAKDMLGRHYSIHGYVKQGRQIGRTIGFPTANVDYGSYFLPQRGVYAVKFYVSNQEYMGMCNIGFNPTFDALEKESLEVFILDFHKDIYGEDVIVEFYKKTRDEKNFDSKEALIKQLQYDENQIRIFFTNNTYK